MSRQLICKVSNSHRALLSLLHLLQSFPHLLKSRLDLGSSHLIGIFGCFKIRSNSDEDPLTDSSSIKTFGCLGQPIDVFFDGTHSVPDFSHSPQSAQNDFTTSGFVRKLKLLNMVCARKQRLVQHLNKVSRRD